jgi:hypothetical protein
MFRPKSARVDEFDIASLGGLTPVLGHWVIYQEALTPHTGTEIIKT